MKKLRKKEKFISDTVFVDNEKITEKQKKKILFVIENLGGGGAERVLVNLVNNMDKSQFEITVLTLLNKGVNADSLSDEVNFVNLGHKKFKGMKTVFKFLPKKLLYCVYLKKHIKDDYDLVVAYMTGVPTFVVAACPNKKIAWVHSVIFDDFNAFGLRHIYNKFDKIIGVSECVCDSVKKIISPEKPVQFIPNTNDICRIHSLAEEENIETSYSLNMVTVGCLEKTKGYDRLIPALKRIKNDGFDFNLNILGEGIERVSLENMISKLSLENNIRILGYKNNPYPYVKNADLFVCSSRTEGLSTAVTEAIILGVPVISTNVSGAKEILGENNEYGIVTENNEDALYEGIKRMLSDEKLRKHYADKAKERSKFFDTASTVKQAENLFETI